jgi:cell pole-organizing protein PopZ
MDMTEKNGQPSMEEILASIRRIVAEEPEAQIPHGASAPIIDFRNNPITLNGDGVLDDSSEFDLPAIFRSSSTQQPEKPGPLIGRLTDAIRNATSSQSEPKQQPEVRPMHVVDDNSERGDEPSVGRFGVQSESYPALSTLKPVASAQDTAESRRTEVAQTEAKPASQGWNFTRPSSPPPAAVNEEIKRVMAPFKDTHFMRMNGPAAPAAPAAIASPVPTQQLAAPAPVVEAQKPTPAPNPELPRVVDFGAIIPGRFDRPEGPTVAPAQTSTLGQPARPGTVNGFRIEAAAPAAAIPLAPRAFEPAQPPADPPAVPHYHDGMSSMPPPLTLVSSEVPDAAAHADGQPTGTIEDTTAELLRPMLRAWLSDNMPRMVEKALHIEVAESVRTGKKPTNS